MMENTSKTVTLTKDGDDVIMPLPKDTMKGMNLQVGDYVKFDANVDEGSLVMSRWDGQLELFDDVTKRVSIVVEMENENG